MTTPTVTKDMIESYDMRGQSLDVCFYDVFNLWRTLNAEKRCLLIDVGANFGFMSLFAANLGVDVFAFEPEPKNFNRCKLLLSGFSGCKVFNCAITNIVGETELFLSKNPGRHSLDQQKLVSEGERPGEQLGVRTESLDHFFKRHDISQYQTIFLKVDVEGLEESVIEGAASLLRSYPFEVVYCEVRGNLSPLKNTFSPVSEKMVNMNFELFPSALSYGRFDHKNAVFTNGLDRSLLPNDYGTLQCVPSRLGKVKSLIRWFFLLKFKYVFNRWFWSKAPNALR